MICSSTTLKVFWVFFGIHVFSDINIRGLPGGASGKEPICQGSRPKRCRFSPLVRKIPWRRMLLPTPIFLPRESHGQRSLAACMHEFSFAPVVSLFTGPCSGCGHPLYHCSRARVQAVDTPCITVHGPVFRL